jgi:hypothetical protein
MYKYEYYQYTKLKIRNTSTLKGHNAIFMLGFLCVSSTLNIFEPLLVEITTANKNIKCLASNTTKININFWNFTNCFIHILIRCFFLNFTYRPEPSAGMSIFWKVMEAIFREIGMVSDGHLKMIWACAMARMMPLTDSDSVANLALQFLS